jgi:PBP1b-binding outer membrane lipoprotein LpoB
MKKVTLAMLILAVVATVGCSKKEEAAKPEPAPAPAETPKPAPPPEPAGPVIPDVPMTGSASENLVNVFEAGVMALKQAPDAAAGAAVLNGMLEKYDVADLRAKSRAAKEAGQGATPETKAKLGDLKKQYAEVSTKLGSEDPAAFGEAAKAWAAAWGLN